MEVRLILTTGFRKVLKEGLNELVRFGEVEVTHLSLTQLPELSSTAYQNLPIYMSVSLGRPQQ